MSFESRVVSYTRLRVLLMCVQPLHYFLQSQGATGVNSTLEMPWYAILVTVSLREPTTTPSFEA